MTNSPYTSKEDDIILECIKKSPTNISKAFDNAVKLLKGRSSKAISQRYYTVLRNNNSVIALGNENGLIINTKNTRRDVKNSLSNALLRDNLLRTALNTLDKEKLIEVLLDTLSVTDKTDLLLKVVNNLKT
jgi:hypothetical protein